MSTTCGSDLHFIDGYIPSIVGVYGVMDKFRVGVIINKGLTVGTAQMFKHKEDGMVRAAFTP